MTLTSSRALCVAKEQRRMAEAVAALQQWGMALTFNTTPGGFQYVPRFIDPSEGDAELSADAITIVTQCTADRFWQVARMARIWQGPVSVALYVTNGLHDVRSVMQAMMRDEHLRKW